MALTTAKLTLYNDKGEKLETESLNMSDTCTPKGLADLMLGLTYQAEAATTAHAGFVDWGKSGNEEASGQE